MKSNRSSRRRFLRLLAAGSVAAATLAVPAAAAPAPRRRRTPPPSPPAPSRFGAAVQEEIRKQKGYLEATLKTIREYPLPPGSDSSFVFSVMPPSPPARARRPPAKPLPDAGGKR